MDSPANHRSPWAKLCHYRFSISFRRFFPLSFSFSSLFSSLRPPSLLRSTPFLLTFLPRLLPLLLEHSFILSCFYLLPSAFRPANLCPSVLRTRVPSPVKCYRKCADFITDSRPLTRRPIFTKKRTILQQDRYFDDATIQPSCYIHIFR